jgi:hypothetical protein
VTELVGIDCVNGVIMYNVTTAAAMIAVAQQAIKKAPVTSSFAEEKPQAGLALWINYDRFFGIGQVFLIIPSPAPYLTETGDGLSFHLLSSIKFKCKARQYYTGGWDDAVSLPARIFLRKTEEIYPQVWLPAVAKRRKPGTVNTWLSMDSSLICILRCDLGVTSTCSATAPLGRG